MEQEYYESRVYGTDITNKECEHNKTFCELIECPRHSSHLCKMKDSKGRDFYYCRYETTTISGKYVRGFSCLFLNQLGEPVQYSGYPFFSRSSLKVIACAVKAKIYKMKEIMKD
jgi:hypothetical protein